MTHTADICDDLRAHRDNLIRAKVAPTHCPLCHAPCYALWLCVGRMHLPVTEPSDPTDPNACRVCGTATP